MSSLPLLAPEQAERHRRAIRLRPLDALRAARAGVRNPDDTAQAVRVIGALGGKSMERSMRRFLDSLQGQEILERHRSLLDALVDREALSALPEDSLGRTYLEWVTREQISAEGLVAASDAASMGDSERDGPYAVLGCRMREMHDLLHVVTGYGRDLAGEVGVLAFTFAQTRHSGIAFLLFVGYVRTFFGGSEGFAAKNRRATSSIRERCREGYRLGRKADWIVGADWEALLELPIAEVRRRFRIPEPLSYYEVRSKGAPELAA